MNNHLSPPCCHCGYMTLEAAEGTKSIIGETENCPPTKYSLPSFREQPLPKVAALQALKGWCSPQRFYERSGRYCLIKESTKEFWGKEGCARQK